ncbi:MAG: integration host factor [Acidimicrobiia bacterium]|nr:integration host factor [Acidimicrobiia bacterium]
MGVPASTPEQRAAALAKAAASRRIRAEMKQLLKTGSLSLSDLFERAEADDMVAGMKIAAVLPSMPGMGKVKAKRLMESIGIADTRRIRGLTERQRTALLEHFS